MNFGSLSPHSQEHSTSSILVKEPTPVGYFVPAQQQGEPAIALEYRNVIGGTIIIVVAAVVVIVVAVVVIVVAVVVITVATFVTVVVVVVVTVVVVVAVVVVAVAAKAKLVTGLHTRLSVQQSSFVYTPALPQQCTSVTLHLQASRTLHSV